MTTTWTATTMGRTKPPRRPATTLAITPLPEPIPCASKTIPAWAAGRAKMIATDSWNITDAGMSLLCAPTITTQPQNQSVVVGGTISFGAAASGNPIPTVQWQVLSTDSGATWTDIAGENSETLTFTAAYIQNGSQYRAVFTNSEGSATTDAAALTVSKKTAICNITGWSGPYDGSAHGASGTCTSSDGTELAGLNLGATFTNVSGGTASWTFSGGSDYYDQSGDVTIEINKASATVMLSNLSQTADGSPKPVTVTTVPAGLSVNVTYNGLSTAPSAAGSYAIVATANDSNYQGSSTGTLVINPNVPQYTSMGFTAPLDLGGVINQVNAGQMIPLKWRCWMATATR
jgi:hypothetical protein